MSERPAVSVIVPFAGTPDALERLLAGLAGLELRDGDELIVADNRPGAPVPNPGAPTARVRLVAAAGVRAPGFARNRGARAAAGDWLLFLDADTVPAPDLLDRYFVPAPDARTGVLAGAIVDRAAGDSLVARVSAERGQMSQRVTLERVGRAYAQTANCVVRRQAFEAIGGFDETARAGEDADLCFRLADAGWMLEQRAGAAVEHATRASLPALLAQLVTHGRGAAWLQRRYPGEFPGPRLTQLAGRVARTARAGLAGARRRDRRGVLIALLELASDTAFDLGRLLSNRPRQG
jgi:mycofactocin glycosyltransferase